MQTSHSEKEAQDFWRRVEVIRKAWHYTDDDDAEATLFVDLLKEIEDYLDIPFGN